MAKTKIQQPVDLSAVCASFDKFASKYASWGYDTVFEDLLNTMLYIGSHKTLFAVEYANACEKYGETELIELVLNITDASEGYRDALGEIYMDIASRYKSSALGQFFTPQNIVDLMAALVMPQDSETPMRMGDPGGCGSGRNILVMAKCIGEGRWRHCFEGTDIDMLCVKMTTINCFMNSVPALIFHGDALSNQIWNIFEVQLMRRDGMWLPMVVKLPTSVCDAVEEATKEGYERKLLDNANAQRVERIVAIVEKEKEKNAFQDSLQPEPDKDINPNQTKPIAARSKPRKGTPPSQPALF